VYWTTTRIYVQRKSRRHWRGAAVALTGSAVLAASFAYTGGRDPLPAGTTAAEQPGAAATQGRPGALTGTAATAGTTGPGATTPSPSPPARAKPELGGAPIPSADTGRERPPAVVSALDRRRSFAARLLDNPRLTLRASSRDQLASGRVSLETMQALESALTRQRLSVVSFGGATAGGLLRTVTVNGVNRVPLRPADARTTAVVTTFRSLPAELQPATDTVTELAGQTVVVLNFE
jgi:hypothetical protein